MTDNKKMFWNSESTLNVKDKSYTKGEAVDISKLSKEKVESFKKSKKLVDKIDANTADDAQKSAVAALVKKNEELQKECTKYKQSHQAAEEMKKALEDAKTELKGLKAVNEKLEKELKAATK